MSKRKTEEETTSPVPSSYPWRPSNHASYNQVRAIASTLGTSMSNVLDDTVAYYINNGGLAEAVAEKQRDLETIKKLSGV